MSKIDNALRDGYWEWKCARDNDSPKMFPAEIKAALAKAGLAIVPVEPTEAMLEAGEETFESTYTGTVTSSPDLVWQAMLRASQQETPTDSEAEEKSEWKGSWER